jgi:hypothetical protein
MVGVAFGFWGNDYYFVDYYKVGFEFGRVI